MFFAWYDIVVVTKLYYASFFSIVIDGLPKYAWCSYKNQKSQWIEIIFGGHISMYKVSHKYLDDFMRLFWGHWLTWNIVFQFQWKIHAKTFKSLFFWHHAWPHNDLRLLKNKTLKLRFCKVHLIFILLALKMLNTHFCVLHVIFDTCRT